MNVQRMDPYPDGTKKTANSFINLLSAAINREATRCGMELRASHHGRSDDPKGWDVQVEQLVCQLQDTTRSHLSEEDELSRGLDSSDHPGIPTEEQDPLSTSKKDVPADDSCQTGPLQVIAPDMLVEEEHHNSLSSRRLQMERQSTTRFYPVVGSGVSGDISVASDLTIPTVASNSTIQEEEPYGIAVALQMETNNQKRSRNRVNSTLQHVGGNKDNTPPIAPIKASIQRPGVMNNQKVVAAGATASRRKKKKKGQKQMKQSHKTKSDLASEATEVAHNMKCTLADQDSKTKSVTSPEIRDDVDPLYVDENGFLIDEVGVADTEPSPFNSSFALDFPLDFFQERSIKDSINQSDDSGLLIEELGVTTDTRNTMSVNLDIPIDFFQEGSIKATNQSAWVGNVCFPPSTRDNLKHTTSRRRKGNRRAASTRW